MPTYPVPIATCPVPTYPVAYLSGVRNLSGHTDLSDADLYGADLSGADLSCVQSPSGANLSGAPSVVRRVPTCPVPTCKCKPQRDIKPVRQPATCPVIPTCTAVNLAAAPACPVARNTELLGCSNAHSSDGVWRWLEKSPKIGVIAKLAMPAMKRSRIWP